MYRIVAITMLATLGTAAVSAQPALQLKARSSAKNTGRSAAAQQAAPKRLSATRRHMVIQFANPLTAEDVNGLTQQGATILQYVPDQALLVSIPETFQLAAGNVILAEALTADNKVSPELAGHEGAAAAVVEFYPDVDASEARQIATIEGIRIIEHADLLRSHVMVEASAAQLVKLAAWDEVAYIYPASSDLAKAERVQPCAGAVTQFGAVGQYVARIGEGWDGAGLGSAELKYVFSSISSKLPADAARAEILRALAAWSKVVKVDFAAGTDSRGTATINILFASGSHGDPYAFDGAGRTLAHTFYPSAPNPEPLAGDMHFDEAESWNIGNDVDLYSVALHELGHALGLGHSDIPGTVMYPYYRRAEELSQTDIEAVRTLYAERTETAAAEPTPTPTPAPTPAPAPAPTPTPAPPPSPAPAPAPTPAANQDKTAPAIAIVTPQLTSLQTSAASVVIKGTASDNIGVASVTWTSNVFGTGVATGTAQWTATVKLAAGQNTIVVRAFDAAGNSSWRSLVITRK